MQLNAGVTARGRKRGNEERKKARVNWSEKRENKGDAAKVNKREGEKERQRKRWKCPEKLLSQTLVKQRYSLVANLRNNRFLLTRTRTSKIGNFLVI